MHFNVLTEPWLTAVSHDGTEREYSLLDLLARAHELKAVVDPAPPIQFGLYRLLIAFVQHALRLQELEDLEDALELGKFDVSVFEAYAKEIGWHRFDLFDPQHPFMQTRPFPDDAKQTMSVVNMFYHLPAGTNVMHFFHMGEKDHAVSPAVAARALCSIAPFMTSGGAGYSPSINGTPPWYVLAVGTSLFQTILLNCCVMHISGLGHEAPPAWASDEVLVPKQEKSAESLVQGWTWQPRRVRLLPSDGGNCTYSGRHSSVLIREIIWGPGFKFAGHDGWLDPHVAYSLDAKRGRLALRPREDRQLWRDYGPLFLLREAEAGDVKFARPAIVDQLSLLKDEGIVPDDTAEQFEVYGMRVDKAKVFEWHFERMPVQTPVLKHPEAGVQVQHALDLAERIAAALHRSLKLLYPRSGGGNAKALDGIIRRAQAQFWTRLEPIFHNEFVRELGRQKVGDEEARRALLAAWKKSLREVGWRCFNEASGALETGADALRRQVLARNTFSAALAKLLNETSTVSEKGVTSR